MPHLPRKQHGRSGSVVDGAPAQMGRLRRGGLGWPLAGTLLFVALGAAIGADSGETHHVTAVRFWSLGGVTRIAVETDGDFQMKWDRLDNPDRLFFDLAGTKPALNHKSMTVIPVADRLLKQIRVAEPQHDVTRVVLDLEGPVESTTSRLENPSRLMIELRAPGSAPNVTAPPAKAPPALIEPTPTTAKPQRRPFTPPPTTRPLTIPVVQPRDASLDPPPALPGRNAPAQVPALLAMAMKPAPLPGRWIAAPITAEPVPASLATTEAGVSQRRPAATEASLPVGHSVTNNNSLPAAQPLTSETALPAKRNASGDRSMIRVLGLKVGRIVLDPGHGGHDTGTVGPGGLQEKDLVLDVAQKLGRLIEKRMGSEVIFTRTDDTFIPLEERTHIANEAKADLFLSIHANSSPYRSAAGVETFYLNFTTSRSSLDVAARENSGSQMTVYELQDLVEKIALKDKVDESREFATRIQNALFTLSAKTTDVRSKDRGVKQAPFVVLIGASMPSVLSEIGFVSNAHDETVMRREEYRERTAEALYKGISSYANSLSHYQVAQRH